MMRHVWIVLAKELLDNFRDRRSLLSTLSSALLTPLLLLAMIVLLGQVLNSNPDEKPLRIPVSGAENAPSLVEYLRQNGAQILPAPLNPEDAVRNGDAGVVLEIPADYGSHFTRSDPAAVSLVMDASHTSDAVTLQRISALLNNYNRLVGAQRLMLRGVSPTILQALVVNRMDVSTPQSRTMIFLYMLPFLLIMNVFMGGMFVIIDATAGERERGSLEPLLTNPVRRSAMVLGKQLASLPFALITMLLTLVMFALIFNLVPIEQILGIPMSLNMGTLWRIFGLCIPMLLLASALQMVVVAFTRSSKEAQTYLSFMPFLASLPSMFAGLLSVKASFETMLIPIFGQALLINQLMRGEAVDGFNVLISAVTTLVVAVVFTLLAIRLYQREQLLFGKK